MMMFDDGDDINDDGDDDDGDYDDGDDQTSVMHGEKEYRWQGIGGQVPPHTCTYFNRSSKEGRGRARLVSR